LGPGYPNGATGYSALNVYITGLGHGLTGYATFPTLLRPTPAAVSQDGVVVDEGSVGNGQETLSREVAYWFGLPVSGCGQFPDFLVRFEDRAESVELSEGLPSNVMLKPISKEDSDAEFAKLP